MQEEQCKWKRDGADCAAPLHLGTTQGAPPAPPSRVPSSHLNRMHAAAPLHLHVP